jgi:hypothetical protein
MPPRPAWTRLQCPSCSKAFGSETTLRQHSSALGRKGAGGPNAGCMFDDRLPIESGWPCRGLRAAGMVQNMNRAAARLVGLDSDSDGSNSAGRGGPGVQLPPVPILPPAAADSDLDVPGPPADPSAPAGGPAAPPAMPQVHRMIIYINTNTYTYVYIHARYVQNTYRY